MYTRFNLKLEKKKDQSTEMGKKKKNTMQTQTIALGINLNLP